MAITYFGSASNPADNASNTTSPATVTPPSNMLLGDLVVVLIEYRSTSTTQALTVSTTGGQTWTLTTTQTSNTQRCVFAWCRFNGTWSANPAFSATSVTLSAVMHVFRPTNPQFQWAVDQNEVINAVSAPSSPFTVTVTGQTPIYPSSVSVAAWAVAAGNTWGTLSGTGWNVAGSAQYRNAAASAQSSTFAYKIQTSAAATGSVSQNESAGTAGQSRIITFYEYAPTAWTVTSKLHEEPGPLNSTSITTTGTVTPSANSITVLVTTAFPHTTGSQTNITSFSGLNSGSWTQIDTARYSTNDATLAVYYFVNGKTPASPSTITVNYDQAVDYPVFQVFEITGIDPAHPIVQATGHVNNSASTTDSISLTNAPAKTDNLVMVAFAGGGGVATGTPASGWTEGSDCTSGLLETQYAAGQQNASITWSASRNRVASIWEMATTPARTIPPPSFLQAPVHRPAVW